LPRLRATTAHTPRCFGRSPAIEDETAMKILFALLAMLALAACGNTAGERAATGGLIGAGVGAGAGALTTPERPRYP
jgi:hypothetical protein